MAGKPARANSYMQFNVPGRALSVLGGSHEEEIRKKASPLFKPKSTYGKIPHTYIQHAMTDIRVGASTDDNAVKSTHSAHDIKPYNNQQMGQTPKKLKPPCYDVEVKPYQTMGQATPKKRQPKEIPLMNSEFKMPIQSGEKDLANIISNPVRHYPPPLPHHQKAATQVNPILFSSVSQPTLSLPIGQRKYIC